MEAKLYGATYNRPAPARLATLGPRRSLASHCLASPCKKARKSRRLGRLRGQGSSLAEREPARLTASGYFLKASGYFLKASGYLLTPSGGFLTAQACFLTPSVCF